MTAKAEDMSCVTDFITEGVAILCSTSKIYPEAMVSGKSEWQEVSYKNIYKTKFNMNEAFYSMI